MTRRLERQSPYWYQTGKELLEQDMKDPARSFSVDGVYNGHDYNKAAPMLRGRYNATVADGDSDFILIHDATAAVTVQVQPDEGGNVTVEYTLDPRDEVINDTATWVAWNEGAVNADTTVRFDRQFTAMRVLPIGAAAEWTLAEV